MTEPRSFHISINDLNSFFSLVFLSSTFASVFFFFVLFLLTHSLREKFPYPILVPWLLPGQVVAVRRK